LEAKIVTLRKDIQKKNMKNRSKFLDDIISSKKSHPRPDLDTIKQKSDQAPKQSNRKGIKLQNNRDCHTKKGYSKEKYAK
jgi:hypothetical protein